METSKRKSVVDLPPVAGVKRPAPSPALLPAFDLDSSPRLPRPLKRVARGHPAQCSPSKYSSSIDHDEGRKYPTPVATSSTGVLSSSPPQMPRTRRPGLQRTISTISERMPLASVPSIELDPSGEPVLLGRSGKSSHYQLSTNKFISRVHVRAAYIAGTSLNLSRIELVCEGWNGVKIHCQGKAWELGKDDSFTSESQDADIMIDVQDARVLLRWPKLTMKVNTPEDTDSNPDSENSPRRVVNGGQHPSPFMSPLRNRVRLQSPVSPTPANQHNLASPSSFLDGSTSQNQGAVQIYEDDASENENADQLVDTQQSTQLLSQPLGINLELSQSYLQEFSDQDEENDPIIHSFGPYGANLLPRMASFTATSPENRPVNVFEEPPSCPEKKPVDDANNPILNHTINQLAYSRLSSTPLSTIMTNLPTDVKAGSKQLTLDMLKALIDRTACLGEVPRAGKDAAGKPLESEYYYIPDKDFDEMRRDAVVEGLRKPGLRNCRKQHKQYFWRKPK